MIQARERRARITRYELTDHEWTAIKSMLPNKPRGVPRANDHLVLDGIFRVLRANIQPKGNRNDPICVSPYLYRDRTGSSVC